MSGRTPYKDRVKTHKCPVDGCDYRAVYPRDIRAHETAAATVQARMKDEYHLFRCEDCGKQYCTAECRTRHACVLPDIDQGDQTAANAESFGAASITETIADFEEELESDADDVFGTPIASRQRRRAKQVESTLDASDEDRVEESVTNALSFQQDVTADQQLPATFDKPIMAPGQQNSASASRPVKQTGASEKPYSCPNEPCAYVAKTNYRIDEHIKIAAKNVENGGATHATCLDCGKSWCTKRLLQLHKCEAKEGEPKSVRKSSKKVKPAKAAAQGTIEDSPPTLHSFSGQSQRPLFTSQSPSPMPTPSKPPKMAPHLSPQVKQDHSSPDSTEPFPTYNDPYTTPLVGNTLRRSPFMPLQPSPVLMPSLSKQTSAARQPLPYGVPGGSPARPETQPSSSGGAFVQPHFATNKLETSNPRLSVAALTSTLGHWAYDILVKDCPNPLSSELNAQEEFAAQLGRYVTPNDFIRLRKHIYGQTCADHVMRRDNRIDIKAVNLQWRHGVVGPPVRSTDEEIEKALEANDYFNTLGPARKIFKSAARSSEVPGEEVEKH